uniref:Uncharacterized protein n=1 Tax=Arion vulgaris TaxID=1028688 RepID=A0A0B7B6G8_9EUPU
MENYTKLHSQLASRKIRDRFYCLEDQKQIATNKTKVAALLDELCVHGQQEGGMSAKLLTLCPSYQALRKFQGSSSDLFF